MAELEEMQWEANGVLLGHGTPYEVLSAKGLEGAATVDLSAMDRHSDGQTGARARRKDRPIRLRIGLDQATAAEQDALEAAFSPSIDSSVPKVLRWRHQGQVTKRCAYFPAANPFDLPGDEQHLTYRHPEVDVDLRAVDPYVYSDAITETSFTVTGGGTDTKAVTNAGAVAAVERGAWSMLLTAGGSGCVNPWLRHGTHTGEEWRLLANLPAGWTAFVGWDRQTLIILAPQYANVRGGGGSPVPTWPILRRGTQNIVMGCASGGFTATFSHRSTW